MHKFKAEVNEIMKICKQALSVYLDKSDNTPTRGGFSSIIFDEML